MTAVTVNPTTIAGKVGDTVKLNTSVTPVDADDTSLTIAIDNTAVASATTSSKLTDGSFNIKLNAVGTTVAHVKSVNGINVDVNITVTEA